MKTLRSHCKRKKQCSRKKKTVDPLPKVVQAAFMNCHLKVHLEKLDFSKHPLVQSSADANKPVKTLPHGSSEAIHANTVSDYRNSSCCSPVLFYEPLQDFSEPEVFLESQKANDVSAVLTELNAENTVGNPPDGANPENSVGNLPDTCSANAVQQQCLPEKYSEFQQHDDMSAFVNPINAENTVGTPPDGANPENSVGNLPDSANALQQQCLPEKYYEFQQHDDMSAFVNPINAENTVGNPPDGADPENSIGNLPDGANALQQQCLPERYSEFQQDDDMSAFLNPINAENSVGNPPDGANPKNSVGNLPDGANALQQCLPENYSELPQDDDVSATVNPIVNDTPVKHAPDGSTLSLQPGNVDFLQEKSKRKSSNSRRWIACPLCNRKVYHLPRHLRSSIHREENLKRSKVLQLSREARSHIPQKSHATCRIRPLKHCPIVSCGKVVRQLDSHFRHAHKNLASNAELYHQLLKENRKNRWDFRSRDKPSTSCMELNTNTLPDTKHVVPETDIMKQFESIFNATNCQGSMHLHRLKSIWKYLGCGQLRDSILNEKRLLTEWMPGIEGKLESSTIYNYLGSLKHFIEFVRARNHRRVCMTKDSLDVLLNTVKLLSKKFIKSKLVKQHINRNECAKNMITKEDVEAFHQSEHYQNVRLIFKNAESGKVLTKSDFVTARDFLILLTMLENSNRTGVLASMTTDQVIEAEKVLPNHVEQDAINEDDYVWIICNPVHKTAKHSLARIVLSFELHHLYNIYLTRIRPLAETSKSKNFFISCIGTCMMASNVCQAAQKSWNNGGPQLKRMTPTLLRKFVSSQVARYTPSEIMIMAKHLAHRVETQQIHYQMLITNQDSARAHNNIRLLTRKQSDEGTGKQMSASLATTQTRRPVSEYELVMDNVKKDLELTKRSMVAVLSDGSTSDSECSVKTEDLCQSSEGSQFGSDSEFEESEKSISSKIKTINEKNQSKQVDSDDATVFENTGNEPYKLNAHNHGCGSRHKESTRCKNRQTDRQQYSKQAESFPEEIKNEHPDDFDWAQKDPTPKKKRVRILFPEHMKKTVHDKYADMIAGVTNVTIPNVQQRLQSLNLGKELNVPIIKLVTYIRHQFYLASGKIVKKRKQ